MAATESTLVVCDVCHCPLDPSHDDVLMLKCGHFLHMNCLSCNQCQNREVMHANTDVPDWAFVGSRWRFPPVDAVQKAMQTWIHLEETITAKDEAVHDPKPWVPLPALQPQVLTDLLDRVPLPSASEDPPDENQLP